MNKFIHNTPNIPANTEAARVKKPHLQMTNKNSLIIENLIPSRLFAAKIGVHPNTLRIYIKNNHIQAVRLSRKVVVVVDPLRDSNRYQKELDPYLKISSVANRIGVIDRTIKNWALEGKFSIEKPYSPNSFWYVERESFEKFVNRSAGEANE